MRSPRGGGISIVDSSMTLSRCRIHGNFSEYGGSAIDFQGEGNVRVLDCTLEENEGGRATVHALWVDSLTFRMENCQIVRNQTSGYVVYLSGRKIDIKGSRISENQSLWDAVRVLSTSLSTVEDCNILFNSGRALTNSSGDLWMTRTRIEGNQGGGVGLYSGAFLSNCLIVNNSDDEDPGVSWGGDDPVSIVNTTIAGNRTDSGIGGISVPNTVTSRLALANSIVWNVGGELEDPTTLEGPGVVASYCCIQGGCPGEGNIEVWPKFQDFHQGEYRLQNESPCIDRGNNGYLSDRNLLDVEGLPRNVGSQVDMGAHEAPASFLPGSSTSQKRLPFM